MLASCFYIYDRGAANAKPSGELSLTEFRSRSLSHVSYLFSYGLVEKLIIGHLTHLKKDYKLCDMGMSIVVNVLSTQTCLCKLRLDILSVRMGEW